jgi:hypothetical protein
MTEHTPGPWTVEEYGDDDCPALVIHRDSENRVCFMATPGSHGDPAKIEADAYLIAAAPDLLRALQDMLAWAGTPQEQASPSWIIGACQRSRDAIAKAKGRRNEY